MEKRRVLSAGLCHLAENLDFFLEAPSRLHFDGLGIFVRLDAGPELNGWAEIAGEPQGCVGADAALLMVDFVDPQGRKADAFGPPLLADSHGLQKLLKEDFSGVNGGKISKFNTAMVGDDFDLTDAFVMPFKADPPLAIDSDRVLPGAVPAQRLKAIGRGGRRSASDFAK